MVSDRFTLLKSTSAFNVFGFLWLTKLFDSRLLYMKCRTIVRMLWIRSASEHHFRQAAKNADLTENFSSGAESANFEVGLRSPSDQWFLTFFLQWPTITLSLRMMEP